MRPPLGERATCPAPSVWWVPVRALLALLLLMPVLAVAETHRFAVVVGNNAGTEDLPPLRYAESDAGKMARVLVELGDVSPDDLTLLQGRTVAELEEAITRVRTRVQPLHAAADGRVVVMFFFSGHSDGEGIELGTQSLPYSRLKALLAGTGADVRVIIVDACRSGAAIHQKGGKAAEPFSIRLNDNLNATGEAFISSSAEDEAALESAEVRGSIFTHNLVSGLRGAADASGDKLVTLGEAYRYAYDQTVSRTALMAVGAQHPNYDYRLSGQGELVVTSLLKPSATLVLPVGAERAFVTDVLRDQVILEVPGVTNRELALPPGQYGVRLFKESRTWGGRVALAEGARKLLTWDELTPLSSSMVVARKGAGGPGVEQTLMPVVPPGTDRVLSLSGGVVPSVSSLGLQGLLHLGFEPRTGWGLSFGLNAARAQVSTVSETALEARVGYRFTWERGLFFLSGGAEVGPGLYVQATPQGSGTAVGGVVAPRGVARVTLVGPLSLALDAEAAVAFVSLDGKLSAVFRPSAMLGVALRFF